MSDVDLFQMIGNFGFPIVMTIYLLHRFEKKIERLEQVVQELAKIISFNRK
ncbi:YvrJ family protein [Sporosarcina cyprini]|uniref:YvrJ family protein n=1 Tax=Sporosarcina cyprini TaxID=2910523 RepID=UPI001EDE1ACA|nr:YvrJ family protein [Sporosarcina cyprini]MCG3086608.1 YvrJ family protein [Sporosarcina cyprini]